MLCHKGMRMVSTNIVLSSEQSTSISTLQGNGFKSEWVILRKLQKPETACLINVQFKPCEWCSYQEDYTVTATCFHKVQNLSY
jgi:hypothetical protein